MKEVIQHPNSILRETSKPVKKIDDKVREIGMELINHLNDSNCVGLSAVQLGSPIRMFAARRGTEDVVIVNPKVIKMNEQTFNVLEGCASINHGKKPYLVTRRKSVKVIGTNLDGEKVVYKAWGLFGHIIQHENDHLNGILILDHGKEV